MIQNAVDAYYTKNNATFPVKDTVILDISNVRANVKGQFTENGETIVNNTITLCEIDYDKIGIDALKYGRKQNGSQDVYVVSRKTGNVYYALGVKIGNDTYYSLSDDIKNILSYNSGKNTVNAPVILFEASATDWTNQNVNLTVKVPIRYTVSEVKINNSILVSQSSTSQGYYIYNVAQEGNYYVKVTYKDNSDVNQTTKEARYTVTNVDKEKPNIEFGNQIKVETENSIGYQEIKSVSDSLSGIKKVKYDYGEYTEDSHFQNGGIEVTDNIIYLKNKYDKVTVYVEDNAGNYQIKVLNVTI